jgi:uncharacterized membrane protein YeaQ/YmgE (transglycosylase-associated protein family)
VGSGHWAARPAARGLRENIDTTARRFGMGWLVTIVLGGIVGWLASIVMKTNAQMGIIANVVVGIVGGAIGFWVAGMLGLASQGSILSWVISVAGAALLIFILKLLGVFK